MNKYLSLIIFLLMTLYSINNNSATAIDGNFCGGCMDVGQQCDADPSLPGCSSKGTCELHDSGVRVCIVRSSPNPNPSPTPTPSPNPNPSPDNGCTSQQCIDGASCKLMWGGQLVDGVCKDPPYDQECGCYKVIILSNSSPTPTP
ncbi:MAG: hypothetical protein A3B68_07255 [Candidatus Melainabacteria bacterium RIFCSPHIGHO2_02_FULL_34_12]|nr:MAG: hypothetical protein A3B68_07255 [Candidatus Melainabacteria bacterium RIFCSPHIGHO2_02_FULL_34_12]